MVAWTRLLIAAGLVALVAGCSNPATGDPVPVGPPTVSCPANVAVSGASGVGQAVTYASPVTTGGTPPVTTTCSPASGSVFPVGTTAVSCTARDALNRPAVCGFTVTVVSSHLNAMNFVAFGDSTTAGENGNNPPPGGSFGNNPGHCTSILTSSASRRVQAARPSVIDLANAYPTQLQAMLQARFPGQSLTVTNEGVRGETAAEGVDRLTTCVLPTDKPGVLLVMEGINDIGGDQDYSPTGSQEQAIVAALQSDVSDAVSAGVSYVFVSTILPVHACPFESTICRVAPPDENPSEYVQFAAMANVAINQTNALIKSRIAGATIVDSNAAMFAADPTLNSFFGDDGLHPDPAGYTVVAQAFMNAIVSRIPITSLRRMRR